MKYIVTTHTIICIPFGHIVNRQTSCIERNLTIGDRGRQLHLHFVAEKTHNKRQNQSFIRYLEDRTK